MSQFQSYLIVGASEQEVRVKSQQISKKLGADLTRVSPDITFVSSQNDSKGKKGTSISIDQVRQIKRQIHHKPVKLGSKIVIVENAQLLTPEAQNALLKLLEEPPSHAIIILEADNKFSLLSTILSRVVTISANSQKLVKQPTIIENSLQQNLELISTINNPQEFIDNQMRIITEDLVKKIKGSKIDYSQDRMVNLIEKCAKVGDMIHSNVNPRFALTSLVFSLEK